MRLKTKLVLAITTLVFLIAGSLSLIYVGQLLHAAVQQTYDANHMVANQVRFALLQALEKGLKDRKVDPNNPAELRTLTAEAVRTDAALEAVIDSVNRYSLTVYDINIGDSQNSTLLSTDPENEDKPLPTRLNYGLLLRANPIRLMRTVFGEPQVFDVELPLARNGELFATVHVGVRTTLLSAQYKPWLAEAFTLMGIALAMAAAVAALLGNLALRPLEQISRQLDYWTSRTAAGVQAEAEDEPQHPQDTAARVSSKIEIIGQRMRNVEEVFSALKENLDQILGDLQDGILLFTGDDRLVLVSEAACRFLQVEQKAILGLKAAELFDGNSALGAYLAKAYAAGKTLAQVEIPTEAGRRIQASMDVIQDPQTGQGLGALITLHDLESVAAIGSELELSRRMAAIGRLTSGVGHEVKNPINAIVVHLELLKTKLGEAGEGAGRHLEIIDSEIHRLDRVVQTLVDFSRPVELDLRERDLRKVIGDVLALSADELTLRRVKLVSAVPDEPLLVKVDADLIKQAALNVIQNGAQAMAEGGELRVSLEADAARRMAVLRVADQGTGIAEEIRHKIFDLYFTTKAGGSGIGLAMTYRILQLHNGGVEVQSLEEGGTEFVLRIPLTAPDGNRRPARTAG